MVEYALEDADGTQYDLNGSSIESIARKSITYEDARLRFDNNIIAKSFLPGDIVIGAPRLLSREINLILNRSADNFETQLNELIYNLEKAVYLVNTTDSKRIKVRMMDMNIQYDKGAHRKSSNESISLTCLNPFWEDTIETTILSQSLTGSANNDITIDNQGYLRTYGTLTFTASAAVAQVVAYMINNKEGIKFNDPLFGSGTYNELILDNIEGTLILEDDFDRNFTIEPGTGFFSFSKGSDTLRVTPSADCILDIKYRKRYYE